VLVLRVGGRGLWVERVGAGTIPRGVAVAVGGAGGSCLGKLAVVLGGGGGGGREGWGVWRGGVGARGRLLSCGGVSAELRCEVVQVVGTKLR
jgi:hypothetical protein